MTCECQLWKIRQKRATRSRELNRRIDHNEEHSITCGPRNSVQSTTLMDEHVLLLQWVIRRQNGGGNEGRVHPEHSNTYPEAPDRLDRG